MANDKNKSAPLPQTVEVSGLQLGDFWVNVGDEVLVKGINQGTFLAKLVQATPDMFHNVRISYLEPPKGYESKGSYFVSIKDLRPARPQAIIVADDKNTLQ